MRVRKLELLLADGLVVLQADGTPGWISVQVPSGRAFSVHLVNRVDEDNECEFELDAWIKRLWQMDGVERPTPEQMAHMIQVVAPVIW